MKRTFVSVIALASIAATGLAFAQEAKQPDATATSVEAPKDGKHFKHKPINLEQFSKTDDLKAADTNGDGTLSRDEIEAHVLKKLVQRRADRMERSLDVNGDGTVTIAEIEKQKAKEFAALDRNDDGKLDRKEIRAAHKDGNHGMRGWHGKRAGHHKMNQQ